MVLLVLLLGPPVLLFALITWQVVTGGPLVAVDEWLSEALIRPDRASELLAGLGNVQVAVPVLLAALAHTAWHGQRRGHDRWWLPPLAGALTMLLVPMLVVPLKEWTDRPGTPAVPPAVGYYPSGHTATAVVAYGTATVLLLTSLRSAAVRRGVVVLCGTLILGASYGLVRRGYHWPLDVAASWCLGTVLLTVLWLLVGRSGRRPEGTAGPVRGITPPAAGGASPQP